METITQILKIGIELAIIMVAISIGMVIGEGIKSMRRMKKWK